MVSAEGVRGSRFVDPEEWRFYFRPAEGPSCLGDQQISMWLRWQRAVISNLNLFHGFQGRLPVRWMAIESLNYSVYTTKSDVYVSAYTWTPAVAFAATAFQCTPSRIYRRFTRISFNNNYIYRFFLIKRHGDFYQNVLILCWSFDYAPHKRACPQKTTNHPSVTGGVIKRPLCNW